MSHANAPHRHFHNAKMGRIHAGWAHGHARPLDIRHGDKVEIIAGKDKGKRGEVDRVDPDRQRITVQGVNIHKRHVKAQTQGNVQGGIIDFTSPVSYSNVQLVCRHCDKATRLGHTTLENGSRVLVCRKCGETNERVNIT